MKKNQVFRMQEGANLAQVEMMLQGGRTASNAFQYLIRKGASRFTIADNPQVLMAKAQEWRRLYGSKSENRKFSVLLKQEHCEAAEHWRGVVYDSTGDKLDNAEIIRLLVSVALLDNGGK